MDISAFHLLSVRAGTITGATISYMGTRGPKPGTKRTPDLTIGTRFGRLIITGPAELRPRSDGRNTRWYPVQCDCGTVKSVLASNLKQGITQSCGCFHRERAAEANTTHGDSHRTRLYRIWKAMHERCRNPKAHNYQWYGGRGITVCTAWRDFETFKEWALNHGYSDDLEIDRIKNSKGYSPTNCQWISKPENIRRARTNHG